MTAHSDTEELCGEESLAAPGLRCALPKNHDVHRKGGTAWATDWDAWRDEIEQEVRARVAEELREQSRIEADRLAPYRPGNDAIENAIVVWEFAADWIDPAIENRPPMHIARGDQ